MDTPGRPKWTLAAVGLDIDTAKYGWYTQDAFTHGEDRAPVETDLSAV